MKQTKNRWWEENLVNLFHNGGFRFINPLNGIHWYPYTSGMVGPYYVQSMNIWDSNEGVDYLTTAFGEFSLDQFELLTAGERRDWPFGALASSVSNVPCCFICKDGTSLSGGKIDLHGAKRIAHIGDLNNEGASLRKWYQYVKEAGGKISDAFFLVDRLEDGVEVAEELGIRTHTVLSLDGETWQYLLNENLISSEVYESLMEYWKDRWEWARKKLLTYPERLDELPEEKKEKIMITYENKFPGIRNKIEQKLKKD